MKIVVTMSLHSIVKPVKMFFPLCFLLIAGFGASGQTITDFTLSDLDGNPYSLSSDNDKAAVVIIFTSHQCPFDQYYKGRISRLAADYKGKKVKFILVNSLSDEQDVSFIKQDMWFGTQQIPYLLDPDRRVMTLLQARKTPEAILLAPTAKGFRKIYQGSLDNNPQVASDVKQTYLRSNLEAFLNGKALPYPTNHAVGCMIK